MACRKKTNFDRNRIVDAVPDVLQDRIQSLFRKLEDRESSNCKSIGSCKQLKNGLKTLLNLLRKVQTLRTSSDVEKYLANLRCLRVEFLAINNDTGMTGWTSEEAIGILDELRAYAGSRKDVTHSQQKVYETSASNNEPNFGTTYSPSSSLTSTIVDGYSNNGWQDGLNDENESDPNNSRPPADDLVPAVKNAQSPDNDDPPDGGPVEESTDTNNPPQNAALVMPDNNGIINQQNVVIDDPLIISEDIQDLQERIGLVSFLPYECGEHVAYQRPSNSTELLNPWTSQVTTNPVPVSGDPNNLDLIDTQQAEMVLSTEKHSLLPPNIRL
ncbi:uncharacterized protein [Dysidea avara]|uniref:uncharacterized protein isoform X2 n=1 Tax=Dysidea avara TaxID=196820 RepID=UPI003324D200